ncbi:iron-siderophore ABC transporter substrate-binding protein [Kocuria sp. cx-455]|uniref:iron-siderophore ABC transporter substrate-binding protein n=1 Tax=Kocuria sp. cx-455 TaxID=2771377 RepID=UPI0028057E7E|nr:iron-siderophore ABC transporter substrate-binding protein [Kocuria sp. cx-455]
MHASSHPAHTQAVTRRRLLGSGLALASLMGLAACSTGSRGGSEETRPGATASSSPTDSFPVKVEHALGTTTVDAEPQRVVTVGASSNQDFVAALGVMPVGIVTVAWGGNANGSTDWFDEAVSRLGAQQPEQYDESDGTNFSAVAELRPDLIVAVNSGITQEDYDRLAKIAPVVAYPTGPWVNAWQDQQRLVAQALGRSEAGDTLVEDTEALIASRSEELGDAKGKTFIYGDVSGNLGFYGPGDGRPRFYEELGLTLPAVVTDNISEDEFWREWPQERADELDSDLFISAAEDDEAVQKFKEDPILRAIPAVAKDQAIFFTNKQDVLAGSVTSPLSVPYALDVHIPAIKGALGMQSS